MRIAKNTELLLTEMPSFRFLLVIDVMDGDVLLEKNGETLVRIHLAENDVYADLRYPDGREQRLTGENAKGQEVILTAGYARMGLYVGGVLLDEDFFRTPLDYRDAKITAGSFMHFEAGYEYHSADESAIVEGVADSLDGYRPRGHARTLSHPVVTVIGGRIHLMYLDGRKDARTKNARKLSALFSDDGTAFHGAPIALGIDNVREEDILDAALLKVDSRYYLYYIVKYTAYTTLSCAVSEDGFSFQKTGLDVEIDGISNADITAIAIENAETPHLYFVAGGEVLCAKSIDLLHFYAPARIDAPKVDKAIPVVSHGKTRLLAQKDGALFHIANGKLLPVEVPCENAYPFVYQDALCYVGIKDGAFACGKLS